MLVQQSCIKLQHVWCAYSDKMSIIWYKASIVLLHTCALLSGRKKINYIIYVYYLFSPISRISKRVLKQYRWTNGAFVSLSLYPQLPATKGSGQKVPVFHWKVLGSNPDWATKQYNSICYWASNYCPASNSNVEELYMSYTSSVDYDFPCLSDIRPEITYGS